MQNITMRHVRESEVEEDSSLFYTDLRSIGTRKRDKRVDSRVRRITRSGEWKLSMKADPICRFILELFVCHLSLGAQTSYQSFNQ